MKQYLDLLRLVMNTGSDKPSRGRVESTGLPVKTRGIFGHQMRFSLREGYPLVTTKRIAVNAMVHEMLWFLSGSGNITYLKKHNVKIWDQWADENGDLGPVYGVQWRHWKTPDGGEVDQLTNLIEGIKRDPHGRRHILTAWNVADIGQMALPPCHLLCQFYVTDGRLSCQMYQRSGDLFLGVPFNIASYALLTHMVAHVCGLEVGDFIHTLGDAHIYDIHFEQVTTQLVRTPKALPTLWLNPDVKDITAFTREDIRIDGYQYDEKIVAEVVV